MRRSAFVVVAAMFIMLLAMHGTAWAQCGAGEMAVETRTAACPNACSDGLDNDGDGLVDADDPGCPVIETRFFDGDTLCSDGVDNDGDGLVDSADPDCLGEVLCTDGFDNDGDGATDTADTDCMCMTAATAAISGSGINCTSNDFDIAYNVSLTDILDGCINTSDQITLAKLDATLLAAQPDRYDLGMWLALDGSSAQDGNVCMRQILTPVDSNSDCTTDPSTGGLLPIPDPGPYPILESKTAEQDACGDLGGACGAEYSYPMPITVNCNDVIDNTTDPNNPVAGSNGFVDLGQCGSWNNNSKSVCSSVTLAIPQTAAKCACANFDTPIPGPDIRTVCDSFVPTIENDVVDPGTLNPGETASFDLQFTNSVTGCTSGNSDPGDTTDPFGRTRCGTASFVRFVIDYDLSGTDMDQYGDFYYNDGSSDQLVPDCSDPADLPSNGGALCIDTTANYLVWVPRDANLQNEYGVISATATTFDLPFKYTLHDVDQAPQNLQLDATIWWDNDLDSSSLATAVDLTGAIEQDCTDCSCSTSFSTTPVTLSSLSATRDGDRVRFDWATATEVGTVGFNIYGKTGHGWVKLNDQLIPNRDGDSMERREYSARLSVPYGMDMFRVEDVDIFGKPTRHEQVKLGRTSGVKVQARPIPWKAIRSESEQHAQHRRLARQLKTSGPIHIQTQAATVPTKSATSKLVFDLTVDRSGVYRVTYEDLAAAGFDLEGVLPAKIGLTNRSAEVPVRVSAGKVFGPGSFIEFVGSKLETLYTDTNVYRLTFDAKKPARTAEDSTPPPDVAPTDRYTATHAVAINSQYVAASPTGDPWCQARLLTGSTPKSWDFPLDVDDLVGDGAGSVLRVHLFGGIDPTGSPDHHVRLLLNGTALGEFFGDGVEDMPLEVALPTGLLHEGSNTLTVTLIGDMGYPVDLVHLEGYSVSYPRRVEAVNNALEFDGPAARYDVGGLTDPDVVVYRQEGGAVTLLTGAHVVGDAGAISVAFAGGGGTYHVATSSAILSPGIEPEKPEANLAGPPASYLIISHPDFLDGLSRLVAAKEAQGFTVKVVDVDDIYAQYGGGIFGPAAIRDYIAFAAKRLKTTHVLLVGGDTYDYHDVLGVGSRSFIPSLYIETSPYVRFAPSDAAMADIDGDGVPDVAIGRFPVRTALELDALVSKTLQYEVKDYPRTAVLTADARDPAANVSFSAASDAMVKGLERSWHLHRAYLDQMSVPLAKTTLMNSIDGGSAITSFVGHSGPSQWTFLGLFNVADVPSLDNVERPTVVVQWGCWNTYYVSPTSESLATSLLLGPDQGAAAVLGATTLTEDVTENLLGRLLMPLATTPGTTIGEATLRAKRALAAEHPDAADVLLGWNLLGDPGLVIDP